MFSCDRNPIYAPLLLESSLEPIRIKLNNSAAVFSEFTGAFAFLLIRLVLRLLIASLNQAPVSFIAEPMLQALPKLSAKSSTDRCPSYYWPTSTITPLLL